MILIHTNQGIHCRSVRGLVLVFGTDPLSGAAGCGIQTDDRRTWSTAVRAAP